MKKLLFLLLAVCLISFLTGCDGGGGGSSSGGGGGGGGGTSNIYILSNNVLPGEIQDGTVTPVNGGIRYTQEVTGDTIEMLQTITLNPDNNTFTWYSKTTNITTTTVDVNVTYSGTMAISGSTLTLTTNKRKDNDTSVETAVGPWDDPFTMTNTAITQGEEVFTRQ